MNEQPSCSVCGKISWKTYSKLLMKCSECGLIRAKMDPTPEELQKAYQHDYFFGGEYANYLHDREALEMNFKNRLKDLSQYLLPSTVLIEIGCSYGFFLNLCKQKVRKCIGYDITEEGIRHAVKEFGLEAHCDNFLNYGGEMVDFVCMWDVLEHLPNPGEVVAKVASVVKKGGHFAFTTGDIGSFVGRVRGDKWRLVHPPTHLFYFDRGSITKLLEKNGFKIVSYRHTAVYRNVDSIFKQLLARENQGSLKRKILEMCHIVAQKTQLSKINVGLNLFDIMDVIAVKNDWTVVNVK